MNIQSFVSLGKSQANQSCIDRDVKTETPSLCQATRLVVYTLLVIAPYLDILV